MNDKILDFQEIQRINLAEKVHFSALKVLFSIDKDIK